MDKKKLMRRINRRVTAIAALIILFLVLLEFYAHNYVQIPHLPVIAEEKALKLIPFYYNSTYTFSSEGASWLVAFQGKKPNPSINVANVYIFKIEQNGSLLTQNTNLLILGIHPTGGNRTGYFWAKIDSVVHESNFTVVQIQYELQTPGIFQIDFGLRVRVYQETILGLIPGQEIEIPVKATLSYG